MVVCAPDSTPGSKTVLPPGVPKEAGLEVRIKEEGLLLSAEVRPEVRGVLTAGAPEMCPCTTGLKLLSWDQLGLKADVPTCPKAILSSDQLAGGLLPAVTLGLSLLAELSSVLDLNRVQFWEAWSGPLWVITCSSCPHTSDTVASLRPGRLLVP